MELLPVEAELFSSDGQTFIAKPIDPFHNFANASKMDGNRVRKNNPYLGFSYSAFPYIPYSNNKMH